MRLAEAASESLAPRSQRGRSNAGERPGSLTYAKKKGWDKGLGWLRRSLVGRGRNTRPACSKALKDRRKLDEACLVCFWRGFSPSRAQAQACVRQASSRLFSDWLEHVEQRLESSGQDPEGWPYTPVLLGRRPSGASDARAAKVRRQGGTPFSRVLSSMLGPSLESRAHSGARRSWLRVPRPSHPDRGRRTARRAGRSPPRSRCKLSCSAEAVENSVLTELEQARDAFRFLFSFTIDFASLAARGYGLKVGRLREFLPNELTCALLGIPTMLIFRALWGKEHLDSRIEELRRLYPQVQAQNRFLDALPSKWHPFAAPNGSIRLAAAPDDERQALVEFVQEWAAEHPEDVALITETQEVNET